MNTAEFTEGDVILVDLHSNVPISAKVTGVSGHVVTIKSTGDGTEYELDTYRDRLTSTAAADTSISDRIKKIIKQK